MGNGPYGENKGNVCVLVGHGRSILSFRKTVNASPFNAKCPKITPIITGVIRANKVSIYTGYHVRPVTND